MDKLQVLLILVLASLAIAQNRSELPKPSYARTMLKVSRSLPGETEELKVRTSDGNLATLIVKRREKSSPLMTPKPTQATSNNTDTTETRNTDSMPQRDSPSPSPQPTQSKNKEEVKKSEDAQIEKLRAEFFTESENQRKEERKEEAKPSDKTSGSSVSDKYQSINGKLIDYGRWTPLGGDGRALSFQPETEDYQTWKPLSRNLKSERRPEYIRFGESTLPSGQLLFARNFQDRGQRILDQESSSETGERNFAFPTQDIRSSRTNIGANLGKNRDGKNVPAEVVVRSEINVKSSPKRTPMTLDRDGTPVINGRRVPDEPIDKIQTWRNARVINNKLVQEGAATANQDSSSSTFYPGENLPEHQRFERFFKNVNRRYGRNFNEDGRNVFFEWDPNTYKNEALKAEVYESRSDSYRSNLHKRMLHPNVITTYPTSQLYIPESQKIAPVPLKAGARAPVLQYAHPELGVQPAKIVKNEKRRPDNFPENQHSFTEQRQKKKYVLNDKNIVDSYTTKNYYPNQHFYGLKRPSDTPFWVKISENLKNQFSTGVEKVSQFTRPVIDPLVEATHKISQNLGLSKGKEAQDKVGTIASGSMLIPALGLVASGAALGIGAVAVGRYLDVDVLKRSNEASNIYFERQRALDRAGRMLDQAQTAPGNDQISYGQPGRMYIVESVAQDGTVPNSPNPSVENKSSVLLLLENSGKAEETGESGSVQPSNTNERAVRRKRSLDYLDIFKAEHNLKSLVRSKRLQRKGADSISEIVEIDLPARDGNIQVTELLLPKLESDKEETLPSRNDAILVVEDAPELNGMSSNLEAKTEQSALDDMNKIVEEIIEKSKEATSRNSVASRSERRKRSSEVDQELDDVLQNLENAEIAEVAHIDGDWTNTPCAKRIFCDTMVQKGPDAAIFMEKKMSALLGLIQPIAAVQVSSHFGEVMDAVRRHDCSRFLCPQSRPGNVFF